MQGRTQRGRQGDVSPPFDVGGIFGGFFIHAVFCSYKVAYREKRAASISPAMELLLSKCASGIQQ